MTKKWVFWTRLKITDILSFKKLNTFPICLGASSSYFIWYGVRRSSHPLSSFFKNRTALPFLICLVCLIVMLCIDCVVVV